MSSYQCFSPEISHHDLEHNSWRPLMSITLDANDDGICDWCIVIRADTILQYSTIYYFHMNSNDCLYFIVKSLGIIIDNGWIMFGTHRKTRSLLLKQKTWTYMEWFSKRFSLSTMLIFSGCQACHALTSVQSKSQQLPFYSPARKGLQFLPSHGESYNMMRPMAHDIIRIN